MTKKVLITVQQGRVYLSAENGPTHFLQCDCETAIAMLEALKDCAGEIVAEYRKKLEIEIKNHEDAARRIEEQADSLKNDLNMLNGGDPVPFVPNWQPTASARNAQIRRRSRR